MKKPKSIIDKEFREKLIELVRGAVNDEDMDILVVEYTLRDIITEVQSIRTDREEKEEKEYKNAVESADLENEKGAT